ncbi:hypothetical protein FACS189427_05150 [Planctomycetales bacterium]|nr:hypothetical protein FACS189427_05150 [Planctomycetales bacterium]
MANFFYFDNNGTKQGPYDSIQLIALTKNGSIKPDTLIENEAGKQTKAENITGLFPRPVPPPESNINTSSTENPFINPPSATATFCQYCGEPMTAGEKFCGFCGKSVSQSSSTTDNPFTPGITAGMYNPPSSGGGFLDIGFTRFITPSWISVIWIICIVSNTISFLASLGWIGIIAIGMSSGGRHTEGNPAFGVFVFILGLLASIILHLLSLLFSRVFLELIIVLFKIEKNTRAMLSEQQ